MLKIVSIALFCLSATVAFSQRTFSISATASPTLIRTNHNRTYLYPESDGQIVEPVFLAGTVNTVGYTGGLGAHYTYAPGWSVAAGVWYSQTSSRQARLAAAGAGTTTLRSRTMRLPLLLNYQPLTRRFSPYFSLGLLLDFPLNARVIVDRTDQPSQRLRLRNDKGPVFQPSLGAGGRYQINPRWAVVVQPVWSYNLGRFGGSRTYNSSYEVNVLTQIMYSL
jgi:Outer membrane protein beta-barrel domain